MAFHLSMWRVGMACLAAFAAWHGNALAQAARITPFDVADPLALTVLAEPMTLALFGLGVVVLGLMLRFRGRRGRQRGGK